MAVTLADVAARAGVSTATVSRVLNGNYPVAGETRARVERAVRELDYVTHGPARALAAAASDLVGVLVNDIADPYFGLLAGAVQTEIGGVDGGRLAVIGNTGGEPEQELGYLALLQRERADAVVLTGGTTEDEQDQTTLTDRLRRLAASGVRIVLCGRPALPGLAEAPEVATVDFAHRSGARRLTEHLLTLGHRRIGYIAGPRGRTTTALRLQGHREALEGHPDATGSRVVYGAYDRASGYAGACDLLRREPGLTAVVAANDAAALGACAALRDEGRRVPEEVSVAGFDDLPFSGDAWPPLTTVRVPLTDAGAMAGRLALRRAPLEPGAVLVLPTEVVIRSSTAPPPVRE
ncbi:LacI family DNA-binding transcriptional regulator [Streptomyces sp. JJ36]|uniref:LacI family DNA-binding transcriptional regulator n=1 Tax=Streptomyces sp. JJ36 TaxID=2736645 RepID=UPI001F3B189B|nr:LacI family DNA-binding transcriptional regulator [Streptomyces sp. JJ36]MCF6523962.1 LacI family DNA-binding transcriptional regulator [Streptomyces sp. JJ36]